MSEDRAATKSFSDTSGWQGYSKTVFITILTFIERSNSTE